MTVERLNPAGLRQEPLHTHVVVATGRKMVFVSGQVAFDADGNLRRGSGLEGSPAIFWGPEGTCPSRRLPPGAAWESPWCSSDDSESSGP